MSAPILMNPGKQPVLQDDIESFVWVILFHVLQYTKHSIPLDNIQDIMFQVFDRFECVNGVYSGGRPKEHLCSMPFSFLGHGFKVIGNAPLTDLIFGLLSALAEWHRYVREQRVIHKDASATDDAEPSDAGQPKGFRINPEDLQLSNLNHVCRPPQPTLPGSQTLQLHGHTGVHVLFIKALTSNNWPDSDSAVNNLKDMAKEHLHRPDDRSVLGEPKRKRLKVETKFEAQSKTK